MTRQPPAWLNHPLPRIVGHAVGWLLFGLWVVWEGVSHIGRKKAS